jgi:hypothetical protein
VLRQAKAFDKLGGLSALQNEFIDASLEWRKQQEAQAKRRTQITIGILASFLAVSSGLTLWAIQEQGTAKSKEREAISEKAKADDARKKADDALNNLTIKQKEADEQRSGKEDALQKLQAQLIVANKATKDAEEAKKAAELANEETLSGLKNACLSLRALVEATYVYTAKAPEFPKTYDSVTSGVTQFAAIVAQKRNQSNQINALTKVKGACYKLGNEYWNPN